MRVRRSGHTQRDRGQSRADSWAASALARGGEAAFVVLLVCCSLFSTAATANSRAPTAAPAPQAAPRAPAAGAVTPDPPPQATVRSHAASPPTPSIETTGVRPVSTAGPTTTPRAQTNRAESPSVVPVAPIARDPARRAAHHARHVARRHAHPASPTHRTKSDVTPRSFRLRSLPKALLGLPRAAFRAGEQAHRSGVLLLLSSIAMAALAGASFALLRRLKRLEASSR